MWIDWASMKKKILRTCSLLTVKQPGNGHKLHHDTAQAPIAGQLHAWPSCTMSGLALWTSVTVTEIVEMHSSNRT
jgi:hypothetical protein